MKTDRIIASLAGTYSMVNNTIFRNGTIVPNEAWGLAPVGLLTYTRSGYMSATMAATEEEWRPHNIAWPPKETDSDADWALVGRHAMSYAGHFRINESVPATKYRGQLLHGPMVVASAPAMVGVTQARNYEVHQQGDATYLMVWMGSTWDNRAEVWWKRVSKG